MSDRMRDMSSIMSDAAPDRYRIPSATPPDAPREPGRTLVPVEHYAARKRLVQRSHALVAQTTDGRGHVPAVIREHFADWWYDLRRKQNTIYGSLLRFIDVSILAHAPKWALDLIPQWIQEYIDNEYPDRPGHARRAA